jgi:hypothetical protein
MFFSFQRQFDAIDFVESLAAAEAFARHFQSVYNNFLYPLASIFSFHFLFGYCKAVTLLTFSKYVGRDVIHDFIIKRS